MNFHDKCAFNVWAPSGGAVTDVAFSAYAFHTSELDQIVDRICRGDLRELNGNWLTGEDLNYIERQVEARLGVKCDLTI